MTIEQLRDRICAIRNDVPRYEQQAAIERLCLEYAEPLAQAVLQRIEDLGQRSDCMWCEVVSDPCPRCRPLAGAADDAEAVAVPQAREVLAAPKEAK